jgi:hypothetical protein
MVRRLSVLRSRHNKQRLLWPARPLRFAISHPPATQGPSGQVASVVAGGPRGIASHYLNRFHRALRDSFSPRTKSFLNKEKEFY